jgi:hypothetical protein
MAVTVEHKWKNSDVETCSSDAFNCQAGGSGGGELCAHCAHCVSGWHTVHTATGSALAHCAILFQDLVIQSPVACRRSCLSSARIFRAAQTAGQLWLSWAKRFAISFTTSMPTESHAWVCLIPTGNGIFRQIEPLESYSRNGPSHYSLGWTSLMIGHANFLGDQFLYCKQFRSIHCETRMDCNFLIQPKLFYDSDAGRRRCYRDFDLSLVSGQCLVWQCRSAFQDDCADRQQRTARY